MRLRYQTAFATFIQLAVVTFLVVVGGVTDIIKNCDSSSSCVTDSFLWMVITFMVAIWFITLCSLGYFAQMKRSYKIARVLIVGELFTAFAAFMFLKHPASILSAVGSAVTLGISIWIIVLAFRINQARGARIVTSPAHTPRRRPAAKS